MRGFELVTYHLRVRRSYMEPHNIPFYFYNLFLFIYLFYSLISSFCTQCVIFFKGQTIGQQSGRLLTFFPYKQPNTEIQNREKRSTLSYGG